MHDGTSFDKILPKQIAIAVYSFGTLGKGFDEVMPRQRISSQNH
jgi:hypothetical protein